MLTRYGIDVLIIVFLLTSGVSVASFYLIQSQIIKLIILILCSVLIAFTLYFFRDPERQSPEDPTFVLSPADGKIIAVNEVYESEFLNSEAIMVSIFMSPLNVHVNRYPISGIVKYFKHIDGKHLVAFADKASDINERSLIGIETPYGRILFKQIAGIIARRIVADTRIGLEVRAGERFGMIKFGSRVDVLIPKGRTVVEVGLGDKVYAGETIIAKFLKE